LYFRLPARHIEVVRPSAARRSKQALERPPAPKQKESGVFQVPTEIVTARRKDNGDASLEDVAKASAQMTLGVVGDRRVDVRLSHEDLVRILSNCETARIGKVS
jgi:hypothetical protein